MDPGVSLLGFWVSVMSLVIIPCKAYGAVAALERTQETSVPTPETRVHNITFNLLAYENGGGEDSYPQGFHLKLFGSFRHRYMSLVVPKCESKVVKTLKVVLDQSVSW